MNRILFLVAGLVALLLAPSELSADAAARNLIRSGGGSISFGDAVPGRIDLTGERAFPLLIDGEGAILVAAGFPGEGRAVGFTHGSFLKPTALLDQEPVLNLVGNAIRWAGRSRDPKIGLHPAIGVLAGRLEKIGLAATVFPPGEMRDHDVSVYCVIGHQDLSDAEIVRLFEFANDGGGLVVATTPWAFAGKYEPFSNFPGNQLFSAAGFRFLPRGYVRDKEIAIGSGENARPAMITESSPGHPALAAAKRLLEQWDELASPDLEAAAESLLSGRELGGDERKEFLELLLRLNDTIGPIVPTKESPLVPGRDPVIDAIVELETFFNESAPPGVLYAIPAAADYPGAVPEDAERVTQTIRIDGIHRGWLEGRNAGGWAAKEMRPTGVYAPPGEVVRVTVPARLAGEGFEVVIGSYNGHLRNRERWMRYPDWQTATPIAARVTEASSGLGGLVAVRVPRGADYEEIEVQVEGGVRAPLYVHGETGLDEWKREIRHYPGPWAELASDRMIIAVPSEAIRGLSDPDEVMEIWNGFIDKAAELVSVDREEYRAERIVFDRQTAAGSMHSGYPVAAHLGGASEQAIDSRALREGNWGFFHEYGHNHQHNLWALPGTGETTCNLWSVYLYEEFIGRDRDETHRAIRPLDRRQRLNAYFGGGARFESEWSVWTALETYLMVQEEFGWEPFRKVFDEYNRLDPDERPKGQQEINDQWVIRLSRACGRNLEPFWSTWNLPLGEGVAEALEDLPAWDDHPVAGWAESD